MGKEGVLKCGAAWHGLRPVAPAQFAAGSQAPSGPEPSAGRTVQRGMMLIEALIAVLLFSLGILGMAGLNALSVSSQSDAQYRSEANRLANLILGRVWVSVDHTTTATVAAGLESLKHQETTDASNPCSFSGAASTDPLITDWVSEVLAPGSGLPGATAAMQQVKVANTAAGLNEVTVTLCWRAPGDAAPRRHVMKSLIN